MSADVEWEALKSERDSLRTATDAAREEWRKKAAAVAEPKWTATQLVEFPRSLPAGWHWQRQAHSGTITRRDTPLAQWPEILALLARLEQTPGLTVVKVEIQADGTGGDRHFAVITVEVRIAVETNGNPERAAFLRPLPVYPMLLRLHRRLVATTRTFESKLIHINGLSGSTPQKNIGLRE
ncbi:hypothetical protein OH491_04470 [Termitidicoccus mucosus]